MCGVREGGEQGGLFHAARGAARSKMRLALAVAAAGAARLAALVQGAGSSCSSGASCRACGSEQDCVAAASFKCHWDAVAVAAARCRVATSDEVYVAQRNACQGCALEDECGAKSWCRWSWATEVCVHRDLQPYTCTFLCTVCATVPACGGGGEGGCTWKNNQCFNKAEACKGACAQCIDEGACTDSGTGNDASCTWDGKCRSMTEVEKYEWALAKCSAEDTEGDCAGNSKASCAWTDGGACTTTALPKTCNFQCRFCSGATACEGSPVAGGCIWSDYATTCGDTWAPTRKPTTRAPTKSPTTASPSKAPTARPTKSPTTASPTKAPTGRPSRKPTPQAPSKAPTLPPTARPSKAPKTKAPAMAKPTRTKPTKA